MILNRGRNNMYNVILNFPSEISLTKFVVNVQEQEQYIYTIYDVVHVQVEKMDILLLLVKVK